jgi:hypothetical protein
MENQNQNSDPISDKIHGYLDETKTSDSKDGGEQKAEKKSLFQKIKDAVISKTSGEKDEDNLNETKHQEKSQETVTQDIPEQKTQEKSQEKPTQEMPEQQALTEDLPNTDQKEMKPLMEDKTSDSSDNVTFQGTQGLNQEEDICGIPVEKMTPEIANTLHSIEARRSGGIIQSGGLAAQAQSAAARNVAQGKVIELPLEEVLGEVPLEKMTPEIASTIQSLEARRHGGVVEPGSFASQALSAASRNVAQESGETLGGIPVERITPELASILQSIEARRSGGFIEPGGLAAQAQSIARRNVNQGLVNENTMIRPEDLDLSQIVPEMASALQSLEARHTGGYVEPGGLASQALSASRRNSVGDQGQPGSRRNSMNGQVNEVGGLPLDKITPEIANTLHSIEARRSGGVISSGGPAALAQSAAARNVAQGIITDKIEMPPEDVLGSIPMDKMTPEIASALQSLEARRNGGFVQPGGLASQARSAAQRNLNRVQGSTPSPQRSRSSSQGSTGNGQQQQQQQDGGFSQGGRQRGRVMWIPKSPDQDKRKLEENMGQLNLHSNDMGLKSDMASQNQESQSLTTGKLE